MPLSANPMWRVRKGERTSAAKGCSMFLEPGDVILLFTGASDCTPDGPGSQGTLFFRFGDPWMRETQMLADPIGAPSHSHAPAPTTHIATYAPEPSRLQSQQSLGTGMFNADGNPIEPSYASHQARSEPPSSSLPERPGTSGLARPKARTGPPSSSQQAPLGN